MARKGTPLEIATQGFSSPEALGITTQGFIEPVLGDIIIGGEAGVLLTWCFAGTGGLDINGAATWAISKFYLSSGGILTGGEASFSRTQAHSATGGFLLGGTAGIDADVAPTGDSNLNISGAATVLRSFVWSGQGGLNTGGDSIQNRTFAHDDVDGGLVTGGTAGIDENVINSHIGSGGLAIGGNAGDDAIFVVGITIGRGGAIHRRQPAIQFDWHNPAPEQSPMDYWRKIEQALEQARLREKKLFKYKSKLGGICGPTGKSRIIVVQADLPGSEVVIKSNFEVNDNIKLQFTRLFNNNITQDEILDLDDQFVLDNLLVPGNYDIRTGDKKRFTHKPTKGMTGSANVGFVPATSKTTHIDRVQNIRVNEDEELGVLGLLD